MSDEVDAPSCWFVFTLESPAWDASGIAECAFATAPSLIPQQVVSADAYIMTRYAIAVAERQGLRVVCLSDIASLLTSGGVSWPEVGVDDWEGARDALTHAPILGLFLTLSQHDHSLIGTAGRPDVTMYGPDHPRGAPVPLAEYAGMRKRLTSLLTRDWPGYIERLRSTGKLHEPA